MVSSIIQPTNEITLPPNPAKDDLQQGARMLHRFNAMSLGEGDLMAGGNTLAAMAITLANIAPPGSCLVDGENGGSIPVGMNTLVSGGLSCHLISDRVLKVLQELQGNLYAQTAVTPNLAGAPTAPATPSCGWSAPRICFSSWRTSAFIPSGW